VLGELLRIGDEVSIKIEEESRYWGYNPCPDGTVATVIGFSEMHYGYVNGCGMPAGVYVNDAWTKLRMSDGTETSEWTGRLTLTDPKLEEARRGEAAEERRRLGDDYYRYRRGKEFLRPLPDTAFIEGDLVNVDPSVGFRSMKLPSNVAMISRVEYADVNRTRDDGSPWPLYQLSDDMKGGGLIGIDNHKLTLRERGKVWKAVHNEPIEFKSLEEEAELYAMLGRTVEVRNPWGEQNYAWAQPEIMRGLKAGLIDAFAKSSGMFGSRVSWHCHRFEDRDLGERVRLKNAPMSPKKNG
jgi:hypothetical protein